jgi:site-specific recombinase XerC
MLRAQGLLGLRVKDVGKRSRDMRDTLDLITAKFGQGVQCVLSKSTMNVLEEWIDLAGKRPGDFLFTSRLGGGLTPMSARHLSRLVKTWTDDIRLDASLYGIESLRRTRSIYVLNRTANMEAVRIMLGLADIRTTSRYLSDAKPVDALAINPAYQI